ncbi:MAG: T9SS type A sorting domain-containing protein [Ignavibacteria bacterium]
MLRNIFLALIILLFNNFFFPQWKPAGAEGTYLFNITKIDSSLYAGADKEIFISNGTGLSDWEKVPVDISQVQGFLKHEEKILAVASSGIYELNKQTQGWDQINEDLAPPCILITDDVWIAGMNWRSTNNGKNWSFNVDCDTNTASNATSLLQIDNKIFAVTWKGLQVSYDTGLTWQKINNAIFGSWPCNNTLLNIEDTIYAGGEWGLLKSFDRGNTWEPVGLNYGLSYVINIVSAGNKIFIITSMGVYFSKDYGMNWTKVFQDGYEKGWGFQPFCLETYGENIFLATARGLYYMKLIEFDNPRMKLSCKDKIDIGKIKSGESKDTTIIIENRGYKDLIVSDIEINSIFLELSPKSFTLQPGGLRFINLRVLPNNTGILDASIIIRSNDIDGDKEIPVLNVKPLDFYLFQNYPNPFNPSTTIEYLTSGTNHIRLEVFNIVGERVAVIVNEVKGPGQYKAVFNGGNLSSGVYFYKLLVSDYIEVKKMMLVR